MNLFTDFEDDLKNEFFNDLPIGGGSLGGERFEEFTKELNLMIDENIDLSNVTVQDVKKRINDKK
jgi:hypothetical protein